MMQVDPVPAPRPGPAPMHAFARREGHTREQGASWTLCGKRFSDLPREDHGLGGWQADLRAMVRDDEVTCSVCRLMLAGGPTRSSSPGWTPIRTAAFVLVLVGVFIGAAALHWIVWP